jgi:hypothetical protein
LEMGLHKPREGKTTGPNKKRQEKTTGPNKTGQDTQQSKTRQTGETNQKHTRQKKTAPKKKTQKDWSKKNISLCGHNSPPPLLLPSLFFFVLFHNPIFLLPKTCLILFLIGCILYGFCFCTSVFLFLLFFWCVYQVFAQEKEEGSVTIAKLEVEVLELEQRLEQEQRFDVGLINGGGRHMKN